KILAKAVLATNTCHGPQQRATQANEGLFTRRGTRRGWVARSSRAMTSESGLPPQLLRREARAFGKALKLRPHDRRMDFRHRARHGSKAAIRSRDHLLAADDARITDDALRHELGMLDDHRAMRDHARDDRLALGELHVLPDPPFMLVPRISRLERVIIRADA